MDSPVVLFLKRVERAPGKASEAAWSDYGYHPSHR
jgi:hypothetical protein